MVVENKFEPVLVDSGLNSESIAVLTSGNSWRMNDQVMPLKGNQLPHRFSQAEVPVEEYGVGRAAPYAVGNSYVPGQCTWYAYNRRAQLGRPIGGMWGNGGVWHFSAALQGFLVNHTPEIGAVYEQAGHVSIVEEVGLDNSVRVSEMNYPGAYHYSERWVTGADKFWYIH
ncbi:MAG: CHAP domain-containing protein [Candidatus Ancillula sp.]|jgi:surface antigen|nr:CHAP domain-containing protein [Candidatus Ancillula sp.]